MQKRRILLAFSEFEAKLASNHLLDEELRAYLDEHLAPSRASEIEGLLREQPELLGRLSEIIQQRDQGTHTLGEIWRRNHLSCPARHDLGRYLWGACEPSESEYIRFHLHDVECRFCLASVADLESSQTLDAEPRDVRQIRYFESSAGFLKKRPNPKG